MHVADVSSPWNLGQLTQPQGRGILLEDLVTGVPQRTCRLWHTSLA
jgi:hypothetical protein